MAHEKEECRQAGINAYLCWYGAWREPCGPGKEKTNRVNSAKKNYLTEENQMPFVQFMAEKNYFTKDGIEAAIDWASKKHKTELLSFLMNEQHKRFPKKKKTFEL